MGIDWDGTASVLVGLEAVALVYFLWRSYVVIRHLNRAVRYAGADDWLLKGIRNYVLFVTLAAIYLLTLTGLGAVIGPLTEHFPLLRPINGGILLGVLGAGFLLERGIKRNRGL